MKIDKSVFEGYIWYSDQQKPQVFRNEEFGIEISENQNPYIVEGQLFDHQKMISIGIKYVDGKYVCLKKKIESSDFNRSNVEIKEYAPNRMERVSKLLFLQYWEEQEDDFCECMKVLLPAELVFVGFKKEEK